MSSTVHTVTLVTALGCGLSAGAFFAFSTFIMPALDRLPATGAIETMQSINRTVVTPLFMLALFGSALACVGLAIWAARSLDQRSARLVLAAAALYVVGTIFVTIGGNIPLNDTLDAVNAHGASAAGDWSDFSGPWTLLNHVRTVAALGATALFSLALSGAD